MRLIDADSLLENYNLNDATKYGNKNAKQQNHSYSTMYLYEIADMIEDAPTIEAVPVVHGWIPCSERLPEDGKNCLITYISFLDGVTKCCDGCAYVIENGWFWCLDDSEVNVDVIAWMPLPEPYKGE